MKIAYFETLESHLAWEDAHIQEGKWELRGTKMPANLMSPSLLST